jgi:hypothetical protein
MKLPKIGALSSRYDLRVLMIGKSMDLPVLAGFS